MGWEHEETATGRLDNGKKQTVPGNYEGEVWKSADEIGRVWTGFEWEGRSREPATGDRRGDQTSLEEEKQRWATQTDRINEVSDT